MCSVPALPIVYVSVRIRVVLARLARVQIFEIFQCSFSRNPLN